jgi:hypothetical protein
MTKTTTLKKLDLFTLVKNVKLIIIEDNTQSMKNITWMVILILNN